MKILFSTGSILEEVGGPFHSMQQLVCSIDRCTDIEVQVIGTSTENCDAQSTWGVEAFGIKRLGPKSLHFAPGIQKWLSKSDSIDLVVMNNLWLGTNWTVGNWCRKNGIPYIVSPRGCMNPVALGRSVWKKRLSNWLFVTKLLRNAAAIHCLTSQEAEYASEFGVATAPNAIIPNGVEIQSGVSIGEYLDAENKPLRFVYLGRFHPIKGLEQMIEAFAKLEQAGQLRDWRLELIGEENEHGYLKKLKKLCHAHNLSSKISFSEPQFGDEKFESLKAADVYVQTSFSEGFSMSVLEALSCGTPALITEGCNFKQVEAVNAGWVVPCSIDGIASGIEKVLLTPSDAISQMSSNALEVVRKSYTWDAISRDFSDLFRWILDDSNYRPPFVKD